MPTTDFETPKRATYTPTGSTLAYPVFVLGSRENFGRTDYRIALEENPTMSQYVSSEKLTFDEQEAP